MANRCDCVAYIAEVEAGLHSAPSRELAISLLEKICEIFRCSIHNECPHRVTTSDKAHELGQQLSCVIDSKD